MLFQLPHACTHTYAYVHAHGRATGLPSLCYVVMAYIVMAYILMAYSAMTCIVVARGLPRSCSSRAWWCRAQHFFEKLWPIMCRCFFLVGTRRAAALTEPRRDMVGHNFLFRNAQELLELRMVVSGMSARLEEFMDGGSASKQRDNDEVCRTP